MSTPLKIESLGTCECGEDAVIMDPLVTSHPTTGGKNLRSSDSIMKDDLKETIVAELLDSINSSYENWQQAVTFQDDKLQKYYMKFITTLSATLDKIKKI